VKYIAAIQTLGVLLILAVLGVAGVMLWRWMQKGDGPASQVGNWLKYETPLGAPSRALDSVVDMGTGGRETSVGGMFAWLRETISGDNDQIEQMKRGAPTTQKLKPTNVYSINPRDRT